MPYRTASAEWSGNLTEGTGHITVQSKTLDAPYDFRARTADGKGTNPEELIAAAHAGCFTMQLSALIGGRGMWRRGCRLWRRCIWRRMGRGLRFL